MADEFKTIRDNLFKVLTNIGTAATARDDGASSSDDDRAGAPLEAGARALIGAFFARAGKSKDEVVQIIAREIGLAVAAMIKEPLGQLAKHQKLQISFEFVPKEGDDDPDVTTVIPKVTVRAKRKKRSSGQRKAARSG